MIDYDCLAIPDFGDKTENLPQGFVVSQPFSGPAFIDQISDDFPISWNVRVVCSGRQSERFKAFLEMKDDDGVKVRLGGFFQKSIYTTQGKKQSYMMFMPTQPTSAQQNGHTWTYSFTVYADEEIIPDAAACSPGTVATFDDCFRSKLDCALNTEWT